MGIIWNLGPWEISFIMVIVLMIFGPGKLPDIGQAIGSALRSFKEAKKDEESLQLSEDDK